MENCNYLTIWVYYNAILMSSNAHLNFHIRVHCAQSHENAFTYIKLWTWRAHASKSFTNNISDFPKPAWARVKGSSPSPVGLQANTRRGKFDTISNSSGLKINICYNIIENYISTICSFTKKHLGHKVPRKVFVWSKLSLFLINWYSCSL